MRSLLERRIASVDQSLMLLAPKHTALPDYFRNVTVDARRHSRLVQQVQRLRGRIYVNDGALQREQLSPGGLHRTPEDEKGWHLLVMNNKGRVSSCMWYRSHENTTPIEQLRAWSSPLARLEGWRQKLRDVIESELRRARRDFVDYVEAGGWAVSEDLRRTSDAVLLPLGVYALSSILGGGLGVSTATVRHSSAAILQRLGLKRLEVEGSTIEPYYDPKYDCEMELLLFDSRRPNPRYMPAIEGLRHMLANVAVIAGDMGTVAADPYEHVGHHHLQVQCA